ncbi:ATP-binding cassette domain-containing protein [Paenibacillus caui]|uniref:ATP-binding cassette domain-containing protein n=1 Tax=Paenibacillus caui TaxID=2873927 RepID=UPI001CA8A7B3|nr:ABC transporter ATP-binding protein [Paenibacillus caui]
MQIVKFLKVYLNKFKGLIVALFFLNTTTSLLLGLITPLIQGKVIDSLINSNIQIKYVIELLCLLLTLNLIGIVISYFSNLLQSMVNTKIAIEINFDCVRHIQKTPISYSNSFNSTYLIEQINSDSNVLSSFILSNLLNGLTKILIFLGSVLLIIKINIKIGLILFITFPIYILIYRILKKKIFSSTLSLKNQQSLFFSEMNRLLFNLELIKLNSWDEILLKDSKKVVDVFFEKLFRYLRITNLADFNNRLLLIISNILILLICGLEINNKQMTIGQLTIITSYFNSTFASMQYFINFSKDFQGALVSYERLSQHFQVNKENMGDKALSNIDEIKLDNISFKYSHFLIRNFSYTFNKGNIYGVIGKNGSGKSTLLKLIMGLYENYQGKVLYNGISINYLDIYSARESLIAYVEQNPIMINQNFMENITYGLKKYNQKNLVSLLDKLNLSQNNKDILNNNQNLSGGEIQKTSLIRGLLKNPEVLILDEPTSMMDLESTSNLEQLLAELKRNKIVILVTHSQSIMHLCDYLVNIDEDQLCKKQN